MKSKSCNRCGLILEISTDYFHKTGKKRGGLRGICKLCVSRRKSANYDPKKQRELSIKRRESGRLRVQHEKRVLNKPIQYRAQVKLRDAVRTGEIIRQPCIECGNTKTDGHHPDYTKPLEVIWLCRQHHAELHRKMREDKIINSLKDL